MRFLFVLSLLCLLHVATGRRVHQKADPDFNVKKDDTHLEDEFDEEEDDFDEDPKADEYDPEKIKERCKGLPTKEDKARCVCGSAETPGASKREVENRCRKLKMVVMFPPVRAGPWSCRYAAPYAADQSWCQPFHPFRAKQPKKPVPSPVGPEKRNDDTGDDIVDDLEENLDEDLDLEDEEDIEDTPTEGATEKPTEAATEKPTEVATEQPIEVTTEKPTEEKGEDLVGLCAKVCLPKKSPSDDHGCEFYPPLSYKGADRKEFCNDKCEDVGGLCFDKLPAEGGGGVLGGGSSVKPKPPAPVVEERASDETQHNKDEFDEEEELLEDDIEELDEEDLGESDDIKKEKEKEPTMTCASLVKSSTPAKMVTQAQLKKWCGSETCGSKLKMRRWAICGLADGKVSGPGYGGVVQPSEGKDFDCYINCKGEAEKISGLTEDCISNFGDWGWCSRGCGGGFQRRQLHIKKYPSGGGKACPKPESQRCNTHPCKRRDCFPADASVETLSGKKSMSELRVGDFVRSVDGAGKAVFDEVYFFGHADESKSGDYLDFKLSGSESSMQLSPHHFLPTCPQHGKACSWEDHFHAYAGEVLPGDFIWAADGAGKITLQKVLKTSAIVKKGLYNPYTLGGKIIVNGVVASAHSNWILDDVTPASMAHYLPAMYQVLFLPGRFLYHLAGPSAADMLDVNNPQVAGDKHGHGPEFLGVCVFFSLMAVAAACTRHKSK